MMSAFRRPSPSTRLQRRRRQPRVPSRSAPALARQVSQVHRLPARLDVEPLPPDPRVLVLCTLYLPLLCPLIKLPTLLGGGSPIDIVFKPKYFRIGIASS